MRRLRAVAGRRSSKTCDSRALLPSSNYPFFLADFGFFFPWLKVSQGKKFKAVEVPYNHTASNNFKAIPKRYAVQLVSKVTRFSHPTPFQNQKRLC